MRSIIEDHRWQIHQLQQCFWACSCGTQSTAVSCMNEIAMLGLLNKREKYGQQEAYAPMLKMSNTVLLLIKTKVFCPFTHYAGFNEEFCKGDEQRWRRVQVFQREISIAKYHQS